VTTVISLCEVPALLPAAGGHEKLAVGCGSQSRGRRSHRRRRRPAVPAKYVKKDHITIKNRTKSNSFAILILLLFLSFPMFSIRYSARKFLFGKLLLVNNYSIFNYIPKKLERKVEFVT
jgi:hypothetical protein